MQWLKVNNETTPRYENHYCDEIWQNISQLLRIPQCSKALIPYDGGNCGMQQRFMIVLHRRFAALKNAWNMSIFSFP